MKKELFFLALFFCFIIFCLYADDDIEEPVKSFRFKNRTVEIGLINIEANFSNNFLSASDIFRETMIVDIDNLQQGFRMNLGVNVYPLFFNYNKDDIWGAGFSLGVDAVGIINLSGKMLSFNEADSDKSDINGAAFVEARYNGFFHIEKIKIIIRPALYYPLVYITPDISYTYKNTAEGTILDIGYKIRVYTAFPFEESFTLTAFPGIDFHIGAEYPLSEILGLKQKHSLLDFDVGLDMINLPFVPAFMNNYMEVSGRLGSGKPMDFLKDTMDIFSYNSEDTVYGVQRLSVLRPFKFISWARWRPLKTASINFIPSFGFALSPFYPQPFSLEAGIKTLLDLRNVFIVSFGIGYHDVSGKMKLI